MKDYYCTICGRKHDGKTSSKYCKKHTLQLKIYGQFLDNNPRTKYDPNEFRFVENNIVEFDTYKAPTWNKNKTYQIDAEDYPIVSQYKWTTGNSGYAIGSNKGLLLHRLLMSPKLGQQVDHINLNILDNRKCNLRICNNSLNSSNRGPYNQLQVKGVEFHKSLNRYSAYFRINDKQYHSPTYKTIEEASFARFILEQMFRVEQLTQFTEVLINKLTEEQKEYIIDSIERKFNKK